MNLLGREIDVPIRPYRLLRRQSLLSAGDRTLQRGREAAVEPNGHIVVTLEAALQQEYAFENDDVDIGELIQMPAVFSCGFFGEVHFDLQTALIAKREEDRKSVV